MLLLINNLHKNVRDNCSFNLCANQIETLTSPPGIPGEFVCLVFEEGGNLNFFLVEGGEFA